MTRKDYEAIAAALRKARDESHQANSTAQFAHDIVAATLSGVMARDNPRFDRGRFLKAAGVQS